jgi:hypothetical protein
MKTLITLTLAAGTLLGAAQLPLMAQEPAAGASTSLPDSPAGRTAAALLETVRGGDSAAIRRFVAERMAGRFATRPAEASFALFARMRGDFGTARVVEARPTADGIEVVLEGRERFTLSLQVDPAPPNRITDLSVMVGGDEGGGGPGAAPTGGSPPPEPAATLDDATRRAVVDSVARVLERMYVSADTGRALGELLRRREREGGYASLSTAQAFASALTGDMRSMNGDRHLSVSPVRGRGMRRPGAMGQIEARVLEGNVGYLRMDGLSDDGDALPRLVSALDSLRGTGAMIVDLRGVPGGSDVIANQLISHFTAPGLPSLRVVNRVEGTTVVRNTLAHVSGPRRTEVPLYVLVDGRSASAAEDAPFVLQSLGRATIVGERTAGAGRNNVLVPVGGGMTASISVTRVSDARTGREWEGVGVTPDLAVPSADALETARRAAVERIAANARR